MKLAEPVVNDCAASTPDQPMVWNKPSLQGKFQHDGCQEEVRPHYALRSAKGSNTLAAQEHVMRVFFFFFFVDPKELDGPQTHTCRKTLSLSLSYCPASVEQAQPRAFCKSVTPPWPVSVIAALPLRSLTETQTLAINRRRIVHKTVSEATLT